MFFPYCYNERFQARRTESSAGIPVEKQKAAGLQLYRTRPARCGLRRGLRGGAAHLNDLCSLGQAAFWEESFDKLPFAANKEVRERFKPLTWRGLWIPVKPGAKIHQFIV